MEFKKFIGQSLYFSNFQTNWVFVIILAMTYNFFTVFYFLSIPGFPDGVWLTLEIIVEFMMVIDFLITLPFKLKLTSFWKKMYIMHIQNDHS